LKKLIIAVTEKGGFASELLSIYRAALLNKVGLNLRENIGDGEIFNAEGYVLAFKVTYYFFPEQPLF
jgi:hypothetical protein